MSVLTFHSPLRLHMLGTHRPQAVRVKLRLDAFAALCARCLSATQPDENAQDHLNAAGLWEHGELSETGRHFAHPIRTATTYFRAVTATCEAAAGDGDGDEDGDRGVDAEASGAEFHLWVSPGGVTCARVKDDGVLMWLIEPCEVMPLIAQLLGMCPGLCLTDMVPRPFAATAFDILAEARYHDFAQIIRAYGEPYVTDRGQAWRAAYIERVDTLPGQPTAVDESTRHKLAYLSTPTELYAVHGTNASRGPDRGEGADEGQGTQHQGAKHRGSQHEESQYRGAQHQGSQHQGSQYQGTQRRRAPYPGVEKRELEDQKIVVLTPTVPLLEWAEVTAFVEGSQHTQLPTL